MAGIYLHIPFCESKCIYCDFYSMAGNRHLVDQYLDALLAEAAQRKQEIAGEVVRTVYVGGGTPSLLSEAQLARLVAGLREIFDLSAVEEFTIEVNPDDVTPSYMRAARALGINRVSMGVQSFSDADLALINRRHSAAQAIEAISVMKEAGIENISIDLIYGIPGQTIDTWQQNVDQALSLGVHHISAYTLMYEEGTRLWVMRKMGKIKEVSDDEVAAMYGTLVSSLKQHGFLHYEISNFALPGYHSRHNSSYWDLTPYLGLGVAAHSYDGAVRRYNPSHLVKYIQCMEDGGTFAEEEHLTENERYDEYVMLRLRTSEGIDAEALRNRFGDLHHRFFLRKAEKLVANGMLSHQQNRYFIAENNTLISDSITCDLLWEE
ncbi:MAG: radical SAM family heme chaperone HemW [Bacteroidales bacterium]|nr:radical SAM family heme chaperone HemW [Bacteroidales bacterium]